MQQFFAMIGTASPGSRLALTFSPLLNCMATLRAHGTVLDTFEYATARIAVMSDGRVLKNHGDGWKKYRKANPGVSAETIATTRRESYDLRMQNCPQWAKYIRLLCCTVSLKNRSMLHTAIELMPDDADGIWSSLDDYGINLDLEDIVELCAFYAAGKIELADWRDKSTRH